MVQSPVGLREKECTDEKNRMYINLPKISELQERSICSLSNRVQRARDRHSPQLFHRKVWNLGPAGLLCTSSGIHQGLGNPTWAPVISGKQQHWPSAPYRCSSRCLGAVVASALPNKGGSAQGEYPHRCPEITDQNYPWTWTLRTLERTAQVWVYVKGKRDCRESVRSRGRNWQDVKSGTKFSLQGLTCGSLEHRTVPD